MVELVFLRGGGLGGGLFGLWPFRVCDETALRGLAEPGADAWRMEPKLCMLVFFVGERMDWARFTKFLVSSSLGVNSESELDDSPVGAKGMGAEISRFFNFSRSI